MQSEESQRKRARLREVEDQPENLEWPDWLPRVKGARMFAVANLMISVYGGGSSPRHPGDIEDMDRHKDLLADGQHATYLFMTALKFGPARGGLSRRELGICNLRLGAHAQSNVAVSG